MEQEIIRQILEKDQELFLFLNSFHNATFDQVMEWVSKRFVWIPLYAFLLYIIIKSFGWKTIGILIAIGLTIIISDKLSVVCFKEGFQRLRPCHEPGIQGLVHTVNGYCGGQYGFVSSHAANVFALTFFNLVLFRHQQRYVWKILFLWAVLVGYSRIYLGVHYPLDVVGGAVLGFVVGVVMVNLYLFYLYITTPRDA